MFTYYYKIYSVKIIFKAEYLYPPSNRAAPNSPNARGLYKPVKNRGKIATFSRGNHLPTIGWSKAI